MARGQGYPVGDNKGRIEADTELADEAGVFLLISCERLKELVGARFSNGADLLNNFGTSHADTVVGDADGTRIFIVGDPYFEVGVALIECVIRKSGETQSIDGIRGI